MTLHAIMVLVYSSTWITTLTLLFVKCSRKKNQRLGSMRSIDQSETPVFAARKSPKKGAATRKKRTRLEILLKSMSSTTSRQSSLYEEKMPIKATNWLKETAKTPLSLESRTQLDSKEAHDTKGAEELRWTKKPKFKHKEKKKTLPEAIDTAVEDSYSFPSAKQVQKTQDESCEEKQPIPSRKQWTVDNDPTINDAPSLGRVGTTIETELPSSRPPLNFLFSNNKMATMPRSTMLGPAPEVDEFHHYSNEPDTYKLVRKAEEIEAAVEMKDVATDAKKPSAERSKETANDRESSDVRTARKIRSLTYAELKTQSEEETVASERFAPSQGSTPKENQTKTNSDHVLTPHANSTENFSSELAASAEKASKEASLKEEATVKSISESRYGSTVKQK